jgi:glycosyltransferase involved in cell wall biosynthesis
MKKILFIHNKYRKLGGEDVSFENELQFFNSHFELDNLVFNNNEITPNDITSFFTNKNKSSLKILKKKIEKFNPEIAYIHNTWFKGSLGIFDELRDKNIEILLKLHNLRFYCTKSFFSSQHFNGNKICYSCGKKRTSMGFLNKYYDNSNLKSFFINIYGRKYFQIIKDYDIKILVLSEFHKKFLKDLGVEEDKIHIFPNYIKKQNDYLELNKIEDRTTVLYAGRISNEKGIFDLIDSWKNAKLNNLKLVFVGSGPEEALLSEKIKNEKNIFYKGEVTNKEVMDLMNESRAVVSGTYLHEGQPTLFCEASSLGIPSIFPKSGGILDFFPSNSLFSFERQNLDDLSLKLKLLEDKDLLIKEGIRNKIFIENKLSNENLVYKFKKIIND